MDLHCAQTVLAAISGVVGDTGLILEVGVAIAEEVVETILQNEKYGLKYKHVHPGIHTVGPVNWIPAPRKV